MTLQHHYESRTGCLQFSTDATFAATERAQAAVMAPRDTGTNGDKSPPFPTHKKTDVTEYPEAFRHVGLLINSPQAQARLRFI